MKPLRVGLIVNDGPQSHWLHLLIERSRTSSQYSIDLLIVQRPSERQSAGATAGRTAARQRSRFTDIIRCACFGLLERIENLIVARMARFNAALIRHRLDAFPIARVHVDPVPSGRGLGYRYTAADVGRIRRAGLDMLVQVDRDRRLLGDVCDACRFGIVSLVHGLACPRHRGPAGFWEVYSRNPSTAFGIERIGGQQRRSELLFKGAINTAPLYLLNAVNVHRKSIAFLDRFLESVAASGQLPRPIETRRPAGRDRGAPSLKYQFGYACRTFGHFLERASKRLRGVRWRWAIAYQPAQSWQSADLSSARVVPNPPHRYFADPCLVTREGITVCFVEDYDCRTSHARITAIGIGPDGHREIGVALEEPFHLSYPFVFRAHDELYMCPESAQTREIRLYRCIDFPLRWELHRVLMTGVAAVDTSIFYRDGRWWMLTNIDSADIEEYRSELHIFHADSFDSEHWHAHEGNPVIFDSSRARNGGLFSVGDDLFRVFQTQGFDVYGESMGVASIRELSPSRYEEEVIRRYRPTFLPDIVGTHSLSFDRGILAVDFVRRERC